MTSHFSSLSSCLSVPIIGNADLGSNYRLIISQFYYIGASQSWMSRGEAVGQSPGESRVRHQQPVSHHPQLPSSLSPTRLDMIIFRRCARLITNPINQKQSRITISYHWSGADVLLQQAFVKIDSFVLIFHSSQNVSTVIMKRIEDINKFGFSFVLALVVMYFLGGGSLPTRLIER